MTKNDLKKFYPEQCQKSRDIHHMFNHVSIVSRYKYVKAASDKVTPSR